MKKLIIMRHAKAEKDAPSGEDFDRALAAHGIVEATGVAQALKAYGVIPDFAIVSAAVRTCQTFEAVQAVMGAIPVLLSEDFYNAGSEALRRAVESHENDGQCILVVAHNPGVQFLVAEYLYEGAASPDVLEKVRGNYPTAAATVFDVDAAGRPIYDGLYLAKDL